MTDSVKEIFHTLQGEGAQAGRPAVFCRFAGCNLWSGREQDRAKAICRFCDTDFRGTDGEQGGKYANAEDLADAIDRTWPCAADPRAAPFVVCTGGVGALDGLPRMSIDDLIGFGIRRNLNLGQQWATGRKAFSAAPTFFRRSEAFSA
jgi:hypothetical protein